MQQHISELIDETLQRRVAKTIQKYAKKNAQAFAENKIAGVEWTLQITVLVDNLGLNSSLKSKPNVVTRLINCITHKFKEIFSKA